MKGLWLAAAMALGEASPRPGGTSGTVVFVCEHGTVKSLIAREWFNRRAAERGLGLRAVSRGVAPEASLPPAIAEALGRDGFDVSGFEARAFRPGDAGGAVRIVAIGLDPAFAKDQGRVPIERWEGIPPASEGYAGSRDALRARIEALLTTLDGQGRKR